MSRPLTDRWRLEHVEEGDRCLLVAHEYMDKGVRETSNAFALLAQAHYLAANVRAKLSIQDALGIPSPPSP